MSPALLVNASSCHRRQKKGLPWDLNTAILEYIHKMLSSNNTL